MNFKVTIFTSTFNRAYILPDLYQSLLNQSEKSFEWLVINDGSKDNTDGLLNEWILESKIAIQYIKLENNLGIANAMNIGIAKAKGKLFFKVDSDDVIEADAIKNILDFEKTIPDKDKKKYAGVSGMRFYENGKNVGFEWKFSNNYVDATNFERKKLKLSGDKAEAYYTEVLREYGPFPKFEGEKYAFEGILWDRIAHAGLKIRWFKNKIYKCEYLSDGETNNYFKNCRKNFRAYSYWANAFASYKEAPFNERFIAISKYFAVRNTISLNNEKRKELFCYKSAWIFFAKIYGFIIYVARIALKPKKYRNLDEVIIN